MNKTNLLHLVLAMIISTAAYADSIPASTPDTIILEPLPNTINTVFGEEYGPVMSIDDKTLYFVGLNREDGSTSEDIYVSRRDAQTGQWTKARRIPALSNPYRNEAPTSISGDGSMMLVFVEGRMCFAVNTGRGWSEPRPLPKQLQIGSWQADMQISADGSVLLFAANQKTDDTNKPSLNIFVSERDEDGRWSEPFSIGPAINTDANERSPFLHPDMKTLYFSSDKEGGQGGMDVYVTRRESDSCWTCWSEPVNLGSTINTPGNDCWYRVSADGSVAYFSRKQGQNHDIYTVTLPQDKKPEHITILEPEKPVRIENLLFETGSDYILDESLPELKRLAAFLAAYNYQVLIEGHTDNVGKPADNKKLSEKRAQAVRTELIIGGCSPDLIKAVGYGATRPLVPNDSEENKALNRRVEITIK